MLFDTHAHLACTQLAGDTDDVIRRAREAGVQRILAVGADLATSAQSVSIAAAYPGVYAAAGIHPHDALAASAGGVSAADPSHPAWAAIRQWAERGEIVALGEIGLDYYYDLTPAPLQRDVLKLQLQLAAELDLPVVLHNRESDEDMLQILRSSPAGLRGVLHCYLGGPALRDWALEHGLYRGVAGPVTFRKMDALLDSVAATPLDRILIETDAPYLTPHPLRGKRNEPAYVRLTAERVAELYGLTLEAFAQRTTENACQLFRVA
ncbi:MAG: TatD family hydrolase [Anaerolineae bacterium]|jgi:TatD DNase family protein|nr:TatD family hydrolase [Chloroflexota bacterium]